MSHIDEPLNTYVVTAKIELPALNAEEAELLVLRGMEIFDENENSILDLYVEVEEVEELD